MLNYSLNDSLMNYDYNPEKKSKEEYKAPQPKKDRAIKIPKLYEFQFFDNFEELQAIGRKI
jgi:intein-encoded DNA endonuclease-like protein